jgi:hypothetical protein
MVLRIYSIARFLITTFLLGALAWYGFSSLEKFQSRTITAITPSDELIRVIKDSQINLEKYRLFQQLALLESVEKSVALAENKLNELDRNALREPTEVGTSSFISAIDTSRKQIKLEKEIIANLKTWHQEEDLTKLSKTTIGNLRTEFEKAVSFALNLRRLSLAKIDNQKIQVLHQLKIRLIIVLALALVLYVVELILLLRLLRTKKPTEIITNVTNPVPPPSVVPPQQFREVALLHQNFRKIEETVEDIGERISLMAFNALLEATRAGEAGKGFQIVAEELRRLADRSVKSAGEVKKILEEISAILSDASTSQS